MSDRKPFLIADGYTRMAGFEECQDFEEFTFTYRPLRGLERSQFGHILTLADREEREDKWFEFLTDHVSQWSISPSVKDDIRLAQPVIVGLITNVLDGSQNPDFEIDSEGNKTDPTSDEDDQKN